MIGLANRNNGDGMKKLTLLLLASALAGCGGQAAFDRRLDAPAPVAAPQEVAEAVEEETIPPPPPDPSAIGTGNPFQAGIINPDEDGGPAAAAPPSDGRIGNTIATLGDPGEGGFWLKTPLVSSNQSGRVVYVASGRSVQVELRPLNGPSGGGSQISMQAMRLLDAPLTGFPELVVYGS